MIFQKCSNGYRIVSWVCKSVLGTQRMYSQHQNEFPSISYEIIRLGVGKACYKISAFFMRFDVHYCVCEYCKEEMIIDPDDFKITL